MFCLSVCIQKSLKRLNRLGTHFLKTGEGVWLVEMENLARKKYKYYNFSNSINLNRKFLKFVVENVEKMADWTDKIVTRKV